MSTEEIVSIARIVVHLITVVVTIWLLITDYKPHPTRLDLLFYFLYLVVGVSSFVLLDYFLGLVSGWYVLEVSEAGLVRLSSSLVYAGLAGALLMLKRQKDIAVFYRQMYIDQKETNDLLKEVIDKAINSPHLGNKIE